MEDINKEEGDGEQQNDSSVAAESTDADEKTAGDSDGSQGGEGEENQTADTTGEKPEEKDQQFISAEEYKALLEGLPEDTRVLVEDKFKRLQGNYTKKTQNLAKLRKDAEKDLELMKLIQGNPQMVEAIKRLRDGKKVYFDEDIKNLKSEETKLAGDGVEPQNTVSPDRLQKIIPDLTPEEMEALERVMPVINEMVAEKLQAIESKIAPLTSHYEKERNEREDSKIINKYGDMFDKPDEFAQDVEAIHKKNPSLTREQAFQLATYPSMQEEYLNLARTESKREGVEKSKKNAHVGGGGYPTKEPSKKIEDMTEEEVLKEADSNNLVDKPY